MKSKTNDKWVRVFAMDIFNLLMEILVERFVLALQSFNFSYFYELEKRNKFRNSISLRQKRQKILCSLKVKKCRID